MILTCSRGFFNFNFHHCRLLWSNLLAKGTVSLLLHSACLVSAVVLRKVIGRKRQDYATRPCGRPGIHCNWNFVYRCRGNLQFLYFWTWSVSKGQEIIIISCKNALYFALFRPSFCSFSGFQCYMMFSWKILPNCRWWKEHSFHKCKKTTTISGNSCTLKNNYPPPCRTVASGAEISTAGCKLFSDELAKSPKF